MRFHLRPILLLIVLGVFLSCTEPPAEPGLSWIAEADSLLQAAVDQGVVAGAVLRVAQGGEVRYEKAVGYAQRYAYGRVPMETPEAMTTDHIFDLASLTKVFATTFGMMVLVDQQKVDLDAPVSTYLPAFSGVHKDSVTVRHLLTHSAGLYPWKPLYYHARTPEETYAYISQLPLAYPVGEARHYSDLGFMLLGYLIEAVSGHPLNAFIDASLYDPLGLEKTAFNPLEQGLASYAATSHGNPFERRMVADDDFGYQVEEDPEAFDGWRDYVLVGEVNDGNAFHAHGGLAGHAGLFSTAAELQVLLELLLEKGVYAGRRLISEDVVNTFLTKGAFGHGLGWAMSTDVIPVDSLPAGSFGHTGFTGTYAVAIPTLDLSLILLTNRQNVGVNDSGSYYSVTPLRKNLTELVISMAE